MGRTAFGATAAEWRDWRWQYAHRLTRTGHLRQIPWLGEKDLVRIGRVVRRYPYAVTPYFLSIIRWEDPKDPIRRQVIPDPAELDTTQGPRLDPLDEEQHTVAPGLIQRYPDRAVLLASHRCSVHCRHCFRKRLWKETPRREDPWRWRQAVSYLRGHPEIREVVLSGGDPLTLDDDELDSILGRLRGIRHIELIRIGSRMPVVMPQRITPGLCRVLEKHGPLWFITQFNHPQEVTPEAAQACGRLLRSGVPVESQTVLLRGVNDCAETMTSLCRGLLRIRVRPYYLHQCDRATGNEHFRTPVAAGMEILRQMQGRVSGLGVPRFVVDLPGRGGKVPLQPDYLVSRRGSRLLFRNHAGEVFPYEDPDG
jgi:lysine 2,3-aminomutase